MSYIGLNPNKFYNNNEKKKNFFNRYPPLGPNEKIYAYVQ